MILCFCWIHFWQPRPKLWDKWPMKFGWMSGNGLKFHFTEINISYPWKDSLLFWRSLLRMFDDGPIFFQLIVRKRRESHNFFSDLFSSNCCYGDVECNFDNLYKIILREGREMFTHCPKLIRNSNSFKTKSFSPTCSSAHLECNFDNSWNSFGSRPKKFVQLPKLIEERQFSRKFFPKIVLMDRWKGKHFWQTRWNCSNRRPKNLGSLSKIEEGNITWWEVFSPEVIL